MANATGLMMGLALGQAVLQLLSSGSGGRGMMGGGMMGAGMQAGASIGQALFGGGRKMGGRNAQGSAFSLPQMQLPDLPGLPSLPGMSLNSKRQALPEAFALVSKLPGRRRYRAAHITADLAKLLEENLSKLDFLESCQVNADTGSLLFVYAKTEAAEAEMDKLALFLREHIFCEPALPPAAPEGTAAPDSQMGLATRSVRHTVGAFSQWLKDNTGGILDASSAAALFFMLRGLRKMYLSNQLPTGSQMFWWAVSLLRGWRA